MKLTDTFKEARRLYKLGFAIHWLHPKSKRPIESGWTTGPRKEWDYLKETYIEGLNVGVRLGTPSKIDGKYLAVVDVDVKSKTKEHLNEALHAVAKLIGVENYKSAPQVRSGRGNGSRHYYLLTDQPFKTFNPAQSPDIIKVSMPSKKPSKKELAQLSEKEIAAGIRLSHAWEISLYSDGRQVVLPPSVHPDSGELYNWKKHLTAISDLPVMDFSSVLPGDDADAGLSGVDRSVGNAGDSAQSQGSGTEGSIASERSGDATLSKLTDFKVEDVELDWLPISKKVLEGIKHGTGVADRSGFLLQASSALISAGLTQNEVLTVLTDPDTYLGAVGYDHAKTKSRARAAAWVYKYTFRKVSDERNAGLVFGKASEMPAPKVLSEEEVEKQNEEFADERNWRQDLDKTAKGAVKPTLKNIDLIFTNAVDGNVFIKDLFANRVEYGADTPWDGKAGEYLQDIDLVLVKRWLADTEFSLEPSTNAILEATSLVAHRMRIHPVREWLSSLKWDGVKRVDTWIKDYCQGEAEEPYLSEVSRKFLLAMVKRVFEPGCQWDYVLVLEGKQGKYKSSIARALASDKWFMDNLPDLKDKDAMLNLQGKWVIELGELTNVKRSDHNLVKAYLVRRTDTVRPHYGRIMADVPRQSVFIGTVNEGQYLKDPTGNRRFWPVKVGECDVKGLTAVRDQLFAEAMSIYLSTNEVLMLSGDATAQATEAQEDRRIDDDETEMREALLEFMREQPESTVDFDSFKARELFVGLNAPWGRWADKSYHMQTAAQVLRNLGFERKKVMGQRIWTRPENSDLEWFNLRPKNLGADPRKRSAPGSAPLPLKMEEFDFR